MIKFDSQRVEDIFHPRLKPWQLKLLDGEPMDLKGAHNLAYIGDNKF